MNLRIMLVDDHRMFREALRLPLEAIVDLQVIGEFSEGSALFAALEVSVPDVLILDISLPDISGIDVARQVRKSYPQIRIVALSGYSDQTFVDEMLKAGALAYVLKSSGADELIAAIRAAAAGQVFLSPELTSRIVLRNYMGDAGGPPPLSILSRREREVLHLLATGKRSGDIAITLDIASATVEVHRRNLRQKLGLHTTAELTRYAIREGLNKA